MHQKFVVQTVVLAAIALALILTSCTDNGNTPESKTATLTISATSPQIKTTLTNVVTSTISTSTPAITIISTSTAIASPTPQVVDRSEPTLRPAMYNPKIILTTDAGISWNTVFTDTYKFFSSINCPSVKVCFVAGENESVLATSDGGKTWGIRSDTVHWKYGSKIRCPTTNICYATQGPSGGPILSTKDGGRTWDENDHKLASFLRTLTCPDPNICYAVGTDDVILKTTDGGKNWQQQQSVTGGGLQDISCSSVTVCYIIAYQGLYASDSDGGTVESTTDGGKTWTRKASGPDFGSFLSISCPAATRCIAVGFSDPYKIVGTADSGKNWQMPKLRLEMFASFNSITCASNLFCVTVGLKVIAVTKDGGNTWAYQTPDFIAKQEKGLMEVSCPSTNTCYAIGY